MTISMYDASVGVFTPTLHTLLRLLDKAEALAAAKGLAVGEILAARLAPDMLPFAGQVKIASNGVKMAIERLSGIDSPKFEESAEVSIEDLRARLNAILAYFETVGPEAVHGSADKELNLTFGETKFAFTGLSYIQTFAAPNTYFHVTTAYNILRNLGAPLQKSDFLGGVG